MKTTISLLIYLISLIFCSANMFAQIHINKEWGTKTGTPEYLEWSSSAIVNDYDLVHVGNTFVNGRKGRGLYQIDVNSLNTVKLINYCKKRYGALSASSDGKSLIGERIDSYLEKDNEGNITGTIMESSSIYLIDLQTLEETKIDLE